MGFVFILWTLNTTQFQCLSGEHNNPVEKIYLTLLEVHLGEKKRRSFKCHKKTSFKTSQLEHGEKITIDSASLMNKGLEVIEAKWAFLIYNLIKLKWWSTLNLLFIHRTVYRRFGYFSIRLTRHETSNTIRFRVSRKIEKQLQTI